MSEIRQRTNKSNGAGSSESNGVTNGHSHGQHGHSKSLSLSSILHTHTHSHGEEDEDEEEHGGEAQMILDALRGRGDAGSRVTLIGLGANVGLTLVKGVAGWYLNSASLLADAGHSLSDLIADLVTLTTLIISSRPPSPLYPLGYGKLESFGTLVVSVFLLLGGIGIGAHSFTMLSEELSHNPNIPKWLIQLLASFSILGDHDHGHGHDEGEGSLSASAILFPIIGLLVKEWLYRLTKKVADEQNSSVLMANALHHRSDAFTGIITVIAIAGSVVLKGVPVDPFGGVLVALLILHSSIGIFKSAILELTDASVPNSTLTTYQNITQPQPSDPVSSIDSLRAVRSGSNVFVDVDITLKEGLSALQAAEAIEGLKAKLRDNRKEVKEVRVSFTIGQ